MVGGHPVDISQGTHKRKRGAAMQNRVREFRLAGVSRRSVSRIYFRFERRLLAELCRAAARTVITVYRAGSGRPDAIQTSNIRS